MKLKAATRLSGHNGVSSTGLCMKIGELAKITETQAETIRFYEREGLLREPPRTEGNYRLYEAEHLERLAFIRHCRSLDMTLDEIRALLRFQDAPRDNCHAINDVLDEHIEHVARRIRRSRHRPSARRQAPPAQTPPPTWTTRSSSAGLNPESSPIWPSTTRRVGWSA